jgi:hypothetical protein
MGRTWNFDPGSERVIPIGRVDPGGSRERTMASLFVNRWWVVFATVCGLVVGAGPVNVFTFGVFLKPITEDLGLSRGAFSAALSFHAAIADRRLGPRPHLGSAAWQIAREIARPR